VQTFYTDELDRSTEQLQLLLGKIEAAAPTAPLKARDQLYTLTLPLALNPDPDPKPNPHP